MEWIEISYFFDVHGSYVVDETKAPFDGNPVLIKTVLGVAEAWWATGEIHETHEETDHTGFEWVILDDTTTAMIDEIAFWMPLPSPPEAP
jgi:hypothetical protein